MALFKTIVSYRDLPLAELAKAKLESEGIPCFLANKNHIGVNWLYSFALGGVKVRVKTEDAEKALQILSEDHTSEISEIDEGFAPAEQNDFCSKCGSSNLIKIDYSRNAGALTLLLGLPLIIFGRRYKCGDCGHKMKL